MENKKSIKVSIPLQYVIARLKYAYEFGKNNPFDSVFEGWLDNIINELEQFKE